MRNNIPAAPITHRSGALHGATLRAVVFDFDGTLAEPGIDFSAMKNELAALARRYAPGAEPAGERPALEWLQALCADLARSDPQAADTLRREAHDRIRAIEAEAAARISLFAFTRGVLADLHARGVGTAVITRNCTPALDAVFPDARAVVGAVLTRDDVDRVKPDPVHLTTALARLGAAPERALMVGDHPLDMETGRRAGVRTAGVLSGGSAREVLVRAGADLVLDDCSGLVAALAHGGLLPHPPMDRTAARL